MLGKVDGNQLELTIRSSRSERTESRTLDEPILLPMNSYYSLASNGWTSGKTYHVRLFDPMTLTKAKRGSKSKILKSCAGAGTKKKRTAS